MLKSFKSFYTNYAFKFVITVLTVVFLSISFESCSKEDAIVIDKEEFNEDKSYKGKWIVVSIILIIGLLGSMLLNRGK